MPIDAILTDPVYWGTLLVDRSCRRRDGDTPDCPDGKYPAIWDWSPGRGEHDVRFEVAIRCEEDPDIPVGNGMRFGCIWLEADTPPYPREVLVGAGPDRATVWIVECTTCGEVNSCDLNEAAEDCCFFARDR